ncbi:alpha/beta hydrolase [Pseudovibrio brasiliensis]|uniref:Alpha/beta hydrolase n=1 Tax=Pseudovibrio brasiliensis TaxID=1898042 RepID=A0ABX8ATP4_9HYPH|nr:alpha/beta hydrolase [Pseudovibrio brasiliensis]QUS58439.1 alpha/beta hydrolase [Pseudovibrio brasiliensis]
MLLLKKMMVWPMTALLVLVVAACGSVEDDYEVARFDRVGDELVMNGVISSSTPIDLRAALDENPKIKRIVMLDVPGSDDDYANLEAGRIVHERGLTTVIPSNGIIASGGTDFFLAGKKRVVVKGARIGVHSWSAEDYTALDLPKSDQEHDKYLKYYKSIGIDPLFYWYTLDAAPPEDVHWMTEAEMKRYKVGTQYTSAL